MICKCQKRTFLLLLLSHVDCFRPGPDPKQQHFFKPGLDYEEDSRDLLKHSFRFHSFHISIYLKINTDLDTDI